MLGRVAAASYEAFGFLGSGGLGRVYRGVHRPSGTPVALKTVRGAVSSAEAYRLLVREAAAAAQLSHPGIVQLLDFVVADARPYLVLELVEGHDIERWIDEWPGGAAIAAAMDQVLEALMVAHAAGILHRDLKPANLLLTESGRIKITDFGMAELVDPLALESDRALGGTPLYMAPEQLDPAGFQGPWTDLYGIGAILYVLLSGREPIDPAEPDWRSAKRRPPRPCVPRSGLDFPRELSLFVERLLHPDIAQRPRFAAEVRARLGELLRRVSDRGRVEPGVVPSSRRLASTLASDPNAPVIRAESDLASAPTALSPSQGSAPIFGSSSVPLESRTGWTRPPPPLPELPFTLPAPAELNAAASLVRMRSPPLVARAAERDALLSLLSRVEAERRAHVLGLVGEAGVGKSRLARWALGEVERSGRMESTAAGYDPSGTSDGLRRALRHLLGPGSSTRWPLCGVDRERLRAWLDGTSSSSKPPLAERIELALAVLTEVTEARPAYVWLDDVAWAHDGALELVERLLDRSDLPVAVVLTLRAGAAEHPRVRARLDALRAHSRHRELAVERLGLDDRAELLGAAAPLEPETARALADALDEPPLFLVQMAQELVTSGTLSPGPRGCALAAGQSPRELLWSRPVAGVLGERVVKLLTSFRERAHDAECVLIRAALIGHHFDEAVLSAAGDRPKPELALVVVGRALLHGILRTEPGGGYRFEHDLVRQAVLDRLDAREDHQAIAAGVARALLQVHGEQLWEVRVRAARLFERAGEHDTALTYLTDTSTELALLSWFSRAREICAEAARWVEARPSARAQARLALAESVLAYFELRYAEGLTAARRGLALAREAEDAVLAARCLASEASLLFYLHRLVESERAATELLAECRVGDAQMAESGVNAAHRLAEIRVLQGDLERARELFALAVEFAEHEPGQRRLGYLALELADIDVARGDVELAERELARCAERAQDPRSGDWREFVPDVGLRLAVRRGDGPKVQEQIVARMEQLAARGDRWRSTAFRLLHAFACVESGDAERAAAAVAAFLEAFAACPHEKALTLWMLGELPGRLEALGLAAQARDVAAVAQTLRDELAQGFSAAGEGAG